MGPPNSIVPYPFTPFIAPFPKLLGAVYSVTARTSWGRSSPSFSWLYSKYNYYFFLWKRELCHAPPTQLGQGSRITFCYLPLTYLIYCRAAESGQIRNDMPLTLHCSRSRSSASCTCCRCTGRQRQGCRCLPNFISNKRLQTQAYNFHWSTRDVSGHFHTFFKVKNLFFSWEPALWSPYSQERVLMWSQKKHKWKVLSKKCLNVKQKLGTRNVWMCECSVWSLSLAISLSLSLFLTLTLSQSHIQSLSTCWSLIQVDHPLHATTVEQAWL